MYRFTLMFSLIVLVFLASLTLADIPKLINYQGMLTNISGEPLTGTFDTFFRIYNAPSGGDKRWEENHPALSVSQGLFNVILGSQSGGIHLDFSEGYWLEVVVEGEVMPRIEFASVGYAYRALVADSARVTTPGSGSHWSVNDSVLCTNNFWGIARGGAGNVFDGDSTHTHVNLGVACVTGYGAGLDAGHQTVSGGLGNTARFSFATVGGGEDNTAYLGYATVGGGSGNEANGPWATVGGGLGNRASGDYFGPTVAGGVENTAWRAYATVGGGYKNYAFGYGATVPGGYQDSAVGDYSFAAGYRAKAAHYGSFVWADSTNADFSSGVPNEFAVRASGGMRVIANNGSSGGYVDNQPGGGDGLRAYANVSNGNNWGALYAVNYGTSPAIYASASGDLAAYLAGAVYVSDSLHVVGNISKGGGGFKIDHPLDHENKYLYHSFVESPDMMNVYNGNVVLDGNGEASVELAEWFEALNRDFRYQLTCVGGFAPIYVAEKISNNRFRIAGGQPGLEVSWQVTGIRQDAFAEKNRIPVEEDKPIDERGKYLHPEAFDLPETMGVSYGDKKEGRR